jgi:hypothetical protein
MNFPALNSLWPFISSLIGLPAPALEGEGDLVNAYLTAISLWGSVKAYGTRLKEIILK